MSTPHFSSMSTNAVEDLRQRFRGKLRIGEECDLFADLHLEIEEDGFLSIGDRVSIRRGTTIQVSAHATISIGDDVAIGENVFISAMVGIRIGSGCGISNMVDMHDHNHRRRSEENLSSGALTPYDSGFEGAPIIVGAAAIISNKVTLTAGCRVGQNTIVGAHSVVIGTLPPNTVAVGSPATARRKFTGPMVIEDNPITINLSFFGTSIMEHLEGYSERLLQQWDLPPVGSPVIVEGWRSRGYVHDLVLRLQATWPYVSFNIHNHGEGGATSRDICGIIARSQQDSVKSDISFYGCGINDVWRGFQGRTKEAVDIEEFKTNYHQSLLALRSSSRQVVCIGETPFGVDGAAEMNKVLRSYNEAASAIARQLGCTFVDPWDSFINLNSCAQANLQPLTPWSDGVHLSEIGDTLLANLLMDHILREQVIRKSLLPEMKERHTAVQSSGPQFAKYRAL